jgi:hypothetical protein
MYFHTSTANGKNNDKRRGSSGSFLPQGIRTPFSPAFTDIAYVLTGVPGVRRGDPGPAGRIQGPAGTLAGDIHVTVAFHGDYR